jgi:hypothetical protein
LGEIEYELYLSHELNDAIRLEIDSEWMERTKICEGVAQTKAILMEEITTYDNPPLPKRPMEGITIDRTTMVIIEEYFEA